MSSKISKWLRRAVATVGAFMVMTGGAVMLSGQAHAQLPPPPTYTAMQFQFDCQQEAGEARDRCINYLGGILDLQRYLTNSGQGVAAFCPPLYLSAERARRDFLGWGEQNPYMMVGPPIVAIVLAFQQSYACQ